MTTAITGMVLALCFHPAPLSGELDAETGKKPARSPSVVAAKPDRSAPWHVSELDAEAPAQSWGHHGFGGGFGYGGFGRGGFGYGGFGRGGFGYGGFGRGFGFGGFGGGFGGFGLGFGYPFFGYPFYGYGYPGFGYGGYGGFGGGFGLGFGGGFGGGFY